MATECDKRLIKRHNLEVEVRLEVPPNSNYDLTVLKGNCAAAYGSSKNRTGVDEKVTISETDHFGSDDKFDFYVQVKYVSGDRCDDWRVFILWNP